MKIVDVNGNARECAKISSDPKFPGYLKIDFSSKVRTGYKHSEWYPIKEFIKNNPELKSLTKSVGKKVKDDLGVVSKAGPDKLYDSSKNWEADCYVGYPVWISRGKGEGQLRNITGNNHNCLLIDKKWKILPDKSSQYVVSFNVHDPQVLGNTLPKKEVVSKTKKNGLSKMKYNTVDKKE